MNAPAKLVVALFCIIKLVLHLIADSNSGFQGDELLHIEAGNHLAFGYMEFPPVIGVLAFLQNLFQSDAVLVHHLFAHIASVLIMVYVSKTTVELGGSAKAVFLVLLCILVAPAFGRTQQLFQPVVFSQLFWVLGFYQFARYVKYRDPRFLWYLTFTTVLFFLTKYDALFFIAGLGSLLFFTEYRKLLVAHSFWRNILVFLIMICPTLVWIWANDFPPFQMATRLYETQLDKLSPGEVVAGLFFALNPVAFLVYIPAVFCMFHPVVARFRPLSVAIVTSAVLLAIGKGKAYYFFPIALTVLPFGGIFWERFVVSKRKWLLYPAAVVLFMGALLIPFGLPVFPLENYIKYDYQYEKKDVKGAKYAIGFEERYSRLKWHQTLNELKIVYDSLPKIERPDCVIWGKHYSQAGAIALFGHRYGLPKAFSLHGSFYSWAPGGKMPKTIIAIRNSDARGKDFFEPFFEQVIPVKSIYNPYADEEEKVWQTIFICRNPRQDFNELKKRFANRIFE